VRVIQATANRIRSDNLNERIPVGDVKDEISQLARFLNQMFDRLENVVCRDTAFHRRRFARAEDPAFARAPACRALAGE